MHEPFVEQFAPISLEALNEKAAMLERSENKYIVSTEQLFTLASELNKKFDILEMNGKRIFSYETVYFDDNQHICFYQHKQKKRQRFKIRTRKYVDSNMYFFEVKLKDIRGKTKKFRYTCDALHHGTMTKEAYTFIQNCFQKLYKRSHVPMLSPSIAMSYSRITLVAKEGNERMTIDFQLHFQAFPSQEKFLSPTDFIIIETKSTNGRGIADTLFRKANMRSVSCSKFCIGKIVLKQVTKFNPFRPLIKTYFPHVLTEKVMTQ